MGMMFLMVKRGHLAGMAQGWADGPELGFGEVGVLLVELGRLRHDVAE